MKEGFRLALVGSDSLRGKEIKNLLDRKTLPLKSFDFFDIDVKEEFSKLTEFKGEPKVVHNLGKNSLDGLDLVFLAADRKTNAKFGSLASSQDFMAIDLSETFNEDEKIPLVVAGVNDKLIKSRKPGVIANPHPVSIFLSHFLQPLAKSFGLVRVLAFILEPASVHEEAGIEELAGQSVAMLNSTAMPRKVFKEQLAFNLLCREGVVEKDDLQSLEKRIVSEVRRVMKKPGLPLSLSLVQVPVFHTYSMMIFLELKKSADIPALKKLFEKSAYFNIFSSRASLPSSSVSVAGKDQIHIGPIRKEESFPHSFWIWAVADNLTRGSAVNALEIAERVFSLTEQA